MSRALNDRGSGDRGHFLEIACVPTSTMKSEIDAFIAAKTQLEGKFVFLSFGANYEVDSPAAGEQANGDIKAVQEDIVNSTYRITCRIWNFADDNGNIYPALNIVNKPYNSTLVLQNSCEVNATATYYMFADGTTDGFRNAVIGLDLPASGYADVIQG